MNIDLELGFCLIGGKRIKGKGDLVDHQRMPSG